jgi:hypothetical protein
LRRSYNKGREKNGEGSKMLDRLLGMVLKMGYYCAMGDGCVTPDTASDICNNENKEEKEGE